MRPSDLLLFAKWLADAPEPPNLRPAACRTGISAAYYAAYHTVYAFLVALDCPLEQGGKGHGDVHAWLSAAGIHDLAYAAKVLGDLHEMRLLADYGIDRTDIETEGTVAQAVDQSEEVAAILDACAADRSLYRSVRAALQGEIRRRRL